MLFLQGTRDRLSDLDRLRPLFGRIPHATLKVFEGADHSFHPPNSSGRTYAEVLVEIAETVAAWAAETLRHG